MKAVSQTASQSKPANQAVTGILQRKCACGTHTMGGGQCAECQKKQVNDKPLQTKLAISEPGDIYEQEADRIANQIMATPAHSAANGALPRIQRFSGQSNGQMDAVPASVNRVLASPGRLLEPALRQDMEQHFGHDFSRVRVHSDSLAADSAAAVDARAYTVGAHVVFGDGQYSPTTAVGRRLLAHELTHTLQQSDLALRTSRSTQSTFGRGGIHSPSGIIQRQPQSAAPSVQHGERKPRITKMVFYKPSQAVFFLDDGTTAARAVTRHCDPSPGSFTVAVRGQDDHVAAGLTCRSKPIEGHSVLATEDENPGIYAGDYDFVVVPDEVTRFLQSGKSSNAVPSDAETKARVAEKLVVARVTDDELFDYREAADRPAQSWEELEESLDQSLEERRVRTEKRLATTQALTSDLASSMSFIPASEEAGGQGLDEAMIYIYKDYQKLIRLSGLKGNPSKLLEFNRLYPGELEKIAAGTAAYAASLRASIALKLLDFDIAGIDEFLSRIDSFERAFRNATVDLAVQFLGMAEHVCHRFLVEVKAVEFTRNWDAKAVRMIKTLDPLRLSIQSDLGRLSAEGKRQISEMGLLSPSLKPALAKIETQRQGVLDRVSQTLPKFPFVAWPDFPRERLINATDPADVMHIVSWYLIEHLAGIRDSQESLQSDSKRIYKLDSLLALSKQTLHIADGSIFDLIIRDETEKASEESLLDELKTALLFALMVVSIVVPGGVGVAASIGSAVLSADQAVDMYKRYSEEHAEYKANLRSTDPSQIWVIVAIVGVGLDAKGAIDLLSKPGLLRKAVEEFNQTRNVQRLAKELEDVPGLESQTREAIEQGAEREAARGARAAEGAASSTQPAAKGDLAVTEETLAREREVISEKAKHPGEVRPVGKKESAEGYDFEVDVEIRPGDKHTYRHEKTEGMWCRYSGVAWCGHALGEDADRAIEAARQARRPSLSGKPTENYVEQFLGPDYESQVRFFEGEQRAGTKYGMSITDFHKSGKRATITEVKNINIEREIELGFQDLRDQTAKYLSNLPRPAESRFWLFLDIRGQRLTHLMQDIAEEVRRQTGHVYDHIMFVTEIGVVVF